MKVLIVDDDVRNLELLEDMLDILDHTLLKAIDGRMAISILKENPDTDLVLLDVMMPDMDGYETCVAIKADNELNDIPIILVTALADEASQIKGLKSGAVDYVTKPFKMEILKARINIHLELKKSRDELKDALANIKTLKSLLPICANCKKIREDDGYWEKVETYINRHTDTQFSHSICPECAKELYPDLDLDALYSSQYLPKKDS